MIEYPRPIDVQMVKIFKQAQAQLYEEFLISLETWKDLTYLTARINWISSELTAKYNVYQNIALRESYLEGTLFYDIPQHKEIQLFLQNSDKLDIITRLWQNKELVNWLWGVHVAMVENLLQQWQQYISQATWNVQRIMVSAYWEATLKQTFETIALWEVKGLSIFESRVELVKFFQDKWIWSFVDKWWRKRTLERYGEMLTRTETAKSSIMWTLTQWGELWFVKYKRVERLDACPVCTPHKHDIINLKDWMPYILLHPQCRGYWEPIMK